MEAQSRGLVGFIDKICLHNTRRLEFPSFSHNFVGYMLVQFWLESCEKCVLACDSWWRLQFSFNLEKQESVSMSLIIIF